MKRKSFLLLPFLVFGLSLAACAGKKTNPTPTPTPTQGGDVAVTGISLNKKSIEIQVDGSETLVATVTPSNATDRTVTWKSSSEAVARVSGGVVTGVSEGTTTITAKAGTFEDYCTVKVNAKSVVPTPTPTPSTPVTPTPTTPVTPTPTTPVTPTPTTPVTPTPVASNYTVQFGDGTPIALVEIQKDPEDAANMTHKYKGTSAVTAGQAIKFALDGVEVKAGDENESGQPHNGNNTAGSYDAGYTVHNDVASADVYLKAYDDGGYSFWLTGYVASTTPTPIPTPTPVANNYTVQFGDGTPIALVEVEKESTDAANMTHKYKGSSAVTAGQAIKFALNGAEIKAGDENESGKAHNGNNTAGSYDAGYTVHNDATADVYLKAYDDGGYSFWLTGYVASTDPTPTPTPTPVTNNQYVHYGHGTEWHDEALVANPTQTEYEEVKVLGLQLAVDDEFSICVGQDNWRSFLDMKDDSPAKTNGDLIDAVGDYHNFKVVNAGKYDIYVKVAKGENEKTVYIAKQADAPVVVPVESVTLNEDALNMHIDDTATLVATIAPENATDKAVVWSIKEGTDTVATVDQNGKVTAIGAGTVTVVATSHADETKFDECAVTVLEEESPVVGIEITLKENLNVGDTMTQDDFNFKKVREDNTKVDMTSEEIGQLKYYMDLGCTTELQTNQIYDIVIPEIAAGSSHVSYYAKLGELPAFGVTLTVNALPTYALLVNEVASSVTFTDISSSKDPEKDTWDKQFEAVVTVATGDKLTFTYGGNALSSNPGASGENNNLTYDSEKDYLEVKQGGSNLHLYFKVYSDGYDVYLTSPKAENVTLKVTLANAVPEGYALYVPGQFLGNWINDPTKEKMTPSVDRKTWTLEVPELAQGTYKYKVLVEADDVATYSWNHVLVGVSADAEISVTLANSNADLVLSENNPFDFSIFENLATNTTLKVTFATAVPEYVELFFRSGLTSWDADAIAATKMTPNEGRTEFTIVIASEVAGDYGYKVTAQTKGSTVLNWTANEHIVVIDDGAGQDATVTLAKGEDAVINLATINPTPDFSVLQPAAAKAYSIIGTFGGGNWDNDQAMTVNDGVATISNVTLVKNDQFKIRVDGKWDETYGSGALNLEGDFAKAFGGSGDNVLVKLGGTYTISFTISTGKISISGTITDPIPDEDLQTLSIYLKASEDISWWNSNSAYIVAEIVVGGQKIYAEATYVESYNGNTELKFTVDIAIDEMPTSIKLYRCNPAVVTALPTSAPSEGVWNVSTVGTPGGALANNWCDLSIA